VLATIGFQFVPLLFNFNLRVIVETFMGVVQYLYYQPSYVNLFVIYSFCRIDDLPWGTKGQLLDDTR
jgi:chitin synthase